MKKIQYKVGRDGLGHHESGKIINALLITRDGDTGIGLAFHPRRAKYEVDSFELVRKRWNKDYYESIDKDSYVNVDTLSSELRAILLKKMK